MDSSIRTRDSAVYTARPSSRLNLVASSRVCRSASRSATTRAERQTAMTSTCWLSAASRS
jgi:hypothetical protein